MKKIVLILVGFALLLTICSCTGNGTENTENGTSAEAETTTEKSDENLSAESGTESPNPENDPYWTENY